MKTRSLLLVKPSQLVDGTPKRFERVLTPTRALPYIAALTPPHYEIQIVDDSVDPVDVDADVDLVGITSLLPQVPRAIEIADAFRARGVPVIMGGVGASSVPELVLDHTDALVIGEADLLWPNVLRDFENHRLQRTYKAESFCDMTRMPAPRFDLLNRETYMRSTRASSRGGLLRVPIETARGCPHDCDFCYASRHFGQRVRFRPIEDVVREVEAFPGAYVFFVDDNIGAQPQRAKSLFRALRPLGIQWVGQFSALAARDPEMLDLAAASGCMNAFVGIESTSPESLATVHKEFSLNQSVAETLTAFRRAGIDPHVSLVFGFDGDTVESIDFTFHQMMDLKVHLVYAFILTPLPGTRLYERMEAQGRLLHRRYSEYDTTHAVFRPARMSPEELEEGYWNGYQRFYSMPSVLRRFSDAPQWVTRRRFAPCAHNAMGNLFFGRLVNARIHPLAGGKPRREE